MAGNSWIAQQRESAFRAELSDKTVWINVAAMLLSEGSPVQSCESLFNRVMYVRSHGHAQTLMQMISGGFYGPYNRGEYPSFIAQIRANQALVERLNTAIENAMGGSDTIQGFTDQGLPTDPNGQHQPQIRLYGNVFNDWGGGPGSHDGAAAWRQKFEASAAKPPVVALVPPVTPPAIPPITPPTKPDPMDAIIAVLKAEGKLPVPTITITTDGDAKIVVNGKLVS